MVIHVYGKKDCRLCKSALKKINLLLDRWGMADAVEVAFMDTDTEFGAAEGDFFDVFQTPTVLVMEDEWEVLARWDGEAPPSEVLKDLVLLERPSAAA